MFNFAQKSGLGILTAFDRPTEQNEQFASVLEKLDRPG
jgi:hypothetical protein